MDAWMFGVPNSKGQIVVGRNKPHPLRKCWKDYPDDCSWAQECEDEQRKCPEVKGNHCSDYLPEG